jgi:hypothetical protein
VSVPASAPLGMQVLPMQLMPEPHVQSMTPPQPSGVGPHLPGNIPQLNGVHITSGGGVASAPLPVQT